MTKTTGNIRIDQSFDQDGDLYMEDPTQELETIIFDKLLLNDDEIKNLYKVKNSIVTFTFPKTYYTHSYIVPLEKFVDAIIISEKHINGKNKSRIVAEAEKIIGD